MTKVHLQFNHPEYSDDALNSSITSILEANTLCSMATIKGQGAWINTAFYCFNGSMELYMLTEPSTQHSQNVKENSSVALTMFDTHQEWGPGNLRGLQVFGDCERASGVGLIEGTALYIKRFRGVAKWIKRPEDFAKGIINSKLYVIKPKGVKILDEPAFGVENYITLAVK